mgnify:CR=1 FL=1|tara:strand:- start:624 stop:866 length:243 start_codon:yes stop_codon:yes gene_type:complete
MAHSYQQGRKPLTLEITPFNVRWEELMPELQLEILRFINTAASAGTNQEPARQELAHARAMVELHIRACVSMQADEEGEE